MNISAIVTNKKTIYVELIFIKLNERRKNLKAPKCKFLGKHVLKFQVVCQQKFD